VAFGVRLYLDSERAGPLFKRGVMRQGDRIRASARAASVNTAETIELKGRQDIERAGKFGSRWTEGLHADVSEGGGNIRVNVHHDVPYWRVFEKGATIEGKPLLWIPLSFSDVPRGTWARDYPAPLFRVDRKSGGAPLLFSIEDRQAKYVGKSSVTVPKKFHLTEIVADAARNFRDIYSRYFRQIGKLG
jgi:hypothetical protein